MARHRWSMGRPRSRRPRASVGSHLVTADYGGTSEFAASTSATSVPTIATAVRMESLSAPPNTVVEDSTGTLYIAISYAFETDVVMEKGGQFSVLAGDGSSTVPVYSGPGTGLDLSWGRCLGRRALRRIRLRRRQRRGLQSQYRDGPNHDDRDHRRGSFAVSGRRWAFGRCAWRPLHSLQQCQRDSRGECRQRRGVGRGGRRNKGLLRRRRAGDERRAFHAEQRCRGRIRRSLHRRLG